MIKTSLILSALLVCAWLPSAQASEAIANKAGCMACHAKDKKLIGPAYKDVSAKYKDQRDAEANLFDKVRKGGSGVWGPIPMSPNLADKISDADLKSVVAWIMKGAS